MDKRVYDYKVWKELYKRVYKKTLSADHILEDGREKALQDVYEVRQVGNRICINEGKDVFEKVILLEKAGIRYILPSRYKKHLPVNPKETWNCYLKKADPTMHTFIQEPTIAKIIGERTLPLHDLVDVWQPFIHSHPRTWRFLKLLAIGSSAKGVKLWVCSEPRTGKNSNDNVLKYILNNICKLPPPTLAKLETAAYYNQKLVLNEFSSATPAKIREIEPFILEFCEQNPEFNKHSMAMKKEMNEVDISHSSMIFTYNRVQDVQDDEKFFEDVWNNIAALKDRIPAILLEGQVLERLPNMNQQQAHELMEANFDMLRTLVKNILYYVQNMSKELHGYDRSKIFCYNNPRHMNNIEGLLDALDVDSRTEQEWNDWIVWLNGCANKYKAMLKPVTANGKLVV